MLYENRTEQSRSFSELRADAQDYALCVGSEGGFDPEEIEILTAKGVVPVWLGSRILRCETAPVAALSVLMFIITGILSIAVFKFTASNEK